MQRIYVIHEAVKEGTYPNCRTLAERLEVTDKTVQRDITFMRDELRQCIGREITYAIDKLSREPGGRPSFLCGCYLGRCCR